MKKSGVYAYTLITARLAGDWVWAQEEAASTLDTGETA